MQISDGLRTKGTKAVYYLAAKGCKRQSHHLDPAARRPTKTLVIKIVIYDEDIHHDYHHPGLNWLIGVERCVYGENGPAERLWRMAGSFIAHNLSEKLLSRQLMQHHRRSPTVRITFCRCCHNHHSYHCRCYVVMRHYV